MYKRQELEKKQREIRFVLNELENTLSGQQSLINQYGLLVEQAQQKAVSYEAYRKETGISGNGNADHLYTADDKTPQQLEARYLALTKEVSDTITELQARSHRSGEKLIRKEKELAKKNKYGLQPKDYQELVYAEALCDGLEAEQKEVEKTLNAANEKNNKLTGRIETLNVSIAFT